MCQRTVIQEDFMDSTGALAISKSDVICEFDVHGHITKLPVVSQIQIVISVQG